MQKNPHKKTTEKREIYDLQSNLMAQKKMKNNNNARIVPRKPIIKILMISCKSLLIQLLSSKNCR